MITLMLVIVSLLSVLYFVTPHLESYHHDFEQFVSRVVRQPVQIGRVTLGSSGLEPVLKFRDLVIFNSHKTKKIFQARELQIGIDLIGSLFKWQIKPSLFSIHGSEISVYQHAAGKIELVGITPKDVGVTDDHHQFIPDEISSWLLEQSRINLEDIGLTWHLEDGSVVKITGLYLKLHNGILQHDLKIGGKLKQQGLPATFQADLKLRGNFLKNNLPHITGSISIENWLAELKTIRFSHTGLMIPPSGYVNLLINHSQLSTKLFRHPVLIKQMVTKASWQRDELGLKVNVDKFIFRDDWLSLNGSGALLFPATSSLPIVDLQLKLALITLAKAKLYYPVTFLPPDATTWLDQAFISSKPISGIVTLQGPLEKFPFDHHEGQLVVDTNLRGVLLNYDSKWPRIEDINGKMVVANRSMTILASSAKILGESVKSIKAEIPDLDLPFLHVIGEINADSSTGLRFINLSPLKNSIGSKLQDIHLMGPMHLKLLLDLPLSDERLEQKGKISGDIALYRNQVNAVTWGFSINHLQGNLHFDDGDLVGKDLQGNCFGKSVKLTINTLNPNQANAITQVSIQGRVEVQDFEQAFSVKLDPYISGSFDYESLLELSGSSRQNSFTLNSKLHGIKIDLPKPFSKNPLRDSKFDLQCYFGSNKNTQLMVNYNNQINVALMLKKTDTKSLQVLSGVVRFGKEAPRVVMGTGLTITGSIAKFDWSIWQVYLAKLKSSFAKGHAIIKQINLNIAELHLFGQIFKQVILQAQPINNGWEIGLLMADIDGKVFFPSDNKLPIRGFFNKLHFSEKKQNLTGLKPEDLQSLQFTIDDFRYGDKYFNQLECVTKRLPNGLKIDKLVVNNPKFVINASGSWLSVGNNQSSQLRGRVSSDDIGGLLRHWQLTNNVVGGKGVADFMFRWPDAPYKPTLPTVSGTFTTHITKSRIINLSKQTETKLGLGRVLGVLSLQSLPQRLSLDFSDLTKHGFAFGNLLGEVELSAGNALVKKLNIDGQVAYIKAYGRIGIKAQDYDIKLSAVPHNIASSIPVAATLAGGPVIGLIGLIADRVISTTIKKAVSYTYHITGSWDNPDIRKD